MVFSTDMGDWINGLMDDWIVGFEIQTSNNPSIHQSINPEIEEVCPYPRAWGALKLLRQS